MKTAYGSFIPYVNRHEQRVPKHSRETKSLKVRPWSRLDALLVQLYLLQLPRWTPESLAASQLFGDRTQEELRAASAWDVLHSTKNWTGDELPISTVESMPARLLERLIREHAGKFLIPVLAKFWKKSERVIEREIRLHAPISVATWKKSAQKHLRHLHHLAVPLRAPSEEECLHAQILSFAYRLNIAELRARPEFAGFRKGELENCLTKEFPFRTQLEKRIQLRFGEGWRLLQEDGLDLLLRYSRAFPHQVAIPAVASFFGISAAKLTTLRREHGIRGLGNRSGLGGLKRKLSPIGPFSQMDIVKAFHLLMLTDGLGLPENKLSMCLEVKPKEIAWLRNVPLKGIMRSGKGTLSNVYRDLAILWVKEFGGRVPLPVFQRTLGVGTPGFVKILYAGGMDRGSWAERWPHSKEHRFAAYPGSTLEPEEILHARILIELFGWTPKMLVRCEIFPGKRLTVAALERDLQLPLPFLRDHERWPTEIFGPADNSLNPSGRALYHAYFRKYGGIVPCERLEEFFGFQIRQSPLRKAIGASLEEFQQARRQALATRPPELPGVLWTPEKFTLLHLLVRRCGMDSQSVQQLGPFQNEPRHEIEYHLSLPIPFPVLAEERSVDWLKTQAPYSFMKALLKAYPGCAKRRDLCLFSGITPRTLNIFIEATGVNALEWDALPPQAWTTGPV